MVRDEMANLVYGIERRVPLATGRASRAARPAGSCSRLLERIIGPPPAPPAPVAPIRYQIMNTVPEHWIPFLPVHQPGSVLETRLQRAAMPRLLGSDPAEFDIVEPRTSLLREGLDATPARSYFVNEEEVPRAGALRHARIPAHPLARRPRLCVARRDQDDRAGRGIERPRV